MLYRRQPKVRSLQTQFFYQGKDIGILRFFPDGQQKGGSFLIEWLVSALLNSGMTLSSSVRLMQPVLEDVVWAFAYKIGALPPFFKQAI